MQQTQVIGVPPQMVMMQQPKSLGLAIALTIFFGPLGLLYATVKGGVIMILGGIASWTIFFFTVAMTPAAAIQGGDRYHANRGDLHDALWFCMAGIDCMGVLCCGKVQR